jgi:N-glycosylase/DNA lyase
MKLTIPVPPKFNFWKTVYSHGWCSLPPFEIDKEHATLKQIVTLSSGKNVLLRSKAGSKDNFITEILSPNSPGKRERQETISILRSCFRIDEDLSKFYAEAKKHPDFRWIPKAGVGRLLRAPTVFEDVVKMICTTNCSWALTEVMVGNLCKKLGCEMGNMGYGFPTPEAIADRSEKFLRKEIRAGYRAPYLLELSRRITKGEIDLESWRHSELPTHKLFDEVRSVKGVGPYAAGNIMKLLGRYDYLGIDSWCRKRFFEIHKNGRRTSDKVIEKFYEPFGKWKGLFFWMDVTKHWHEKEFPF